MFQGALFVVIFAGLISAVLPKGLVLAAGIPVKLEDAAAKEAKVNRVLYINSYDRSYKWSNDIEAGLAQRLKSAERDIELSVEYLDGRRFPGTERNDLLAATLAAKYTGYRQDVVVVSDNFAFDFAIAYRQRLFPDLPIVFCGYNNFRPEVLTGIDNITGVNEEVDFAKTVSFAIQVQPAVRNLVFITSTGDASSRRMAEMVEATQFPELRKHYHLIVLKDALMAEINTRLGALPPDSAVFLAGITSDLIEGRRPTPVESGRMILAASPVPVYSFWDFHLGIGILGGHIITGLDQGQAAADMVLRILGGTPADDIPVMMQTPGRNIIDFRVMKKYGIKLSALPEGCSFINMPESAWESYGWYIGAAVAAMSLESFLIIILVLSLRHRKEALNSMRLLSSRLLTSQEEEQRRIAMELHDQTGQDIIFLKLQLQDLRTRLLKDQNDLQAEVDKILPHTDRIIKDVRRMAHGLNPSELQTLGLCTALKALIRNFFEKTHIPVHYDVQALDMGFRPETQIVLYRIFQEALTNIYKHARAKTVQIDVCRQGDTLSIAIKDDGSGFDPCRYRTSEPTAERGMGLSALELRSRMIGADLKISSEPGHGTEINLSVPIRDNRDAL